MPAAIPIAMIASSVIGGALANKRSQTEASKTATTVDPKYSGLQDMILNMTKQRLSSSPDMGGYTGTGVANINRTFDLTKMGSDNNLTARGLAGSPVAAAVDANRDYSRAGEVARFQNTIPLVQDQMQRQNLSDANSVLNFGRGSTSTGTSTGEVGGGAAGSFTNLAQYLGYMYGKGAFGQQQQPAATPPYVPIPGTNGGY